jgi:hypothetical protein
MVTHRTKELDIVTSDHFKEGGDIKVNDAYLDTQ